MASTKTKKKATESRSFRAGLQFPIGRVERMIRQGSYSKRVSSGAPVYLAAVLEYITAEILELAGNSARDAKRARIIPRNIAIAIMNDEDLSKLLKETTIASGGVIPNIHSSLIPKSKKSKKSDSSASTASDY
jgi:histone H3/H4